MKFNKILAIIAFLHCIPAFAQTNANDTVQVLNIMKKYVQTIACGSTVQAKNIIDMTNSESDPPIYYVLWIGDIGCSGGSGTTTANITAVEKNRMMDLGYAVSVYPILEDEVYYGLYPLYIESLKKISDHKIQIVSSEPVNEYSNHPRKKYKFILQSSENNAKWRLVNKILVPN